jgi:iron(III) transport system ATP-binding protein
VGTALGELRACAAEPLRNSQAVTLSVRPEDVALSEERPAGENVCEGVVSAKVFLGEAVDFQVQVGDQLVLARAHPSLRTPVGDRVFLRLAPEKCIVIPDR